VEDAKCNTESTEGEEQTSRRHTEHDNSIITRVSQVITRESIQWVYSVGLIVFLQEQIKDIAFFVVASCTSYLVAKRHPQFPSYAIYVYAV
jgi:uncharacterized membrane protein